mgnify:FL=1
MTDKNVVGQLERLLEPINKKLGVIDKRLDGIDGRLDQHQKNFGVINKKLDQHTRALVNIENTIKMYGDMYQINNDNARKLEKGVVVLEDKNGVEAPPELRLASIS